MEREIYEELLIWKQEHIKLPLMLIGARQTGKTYILNAFCEKEFEDYLYVNLEKQENIQQIFEQTMIPEEIIKNMEAILNRPIDIQKTVIFFDEIQVSERAITSLKFFAESALPYQIVCAGSLLRRKNSPFSKFFSRRKSVDSLFIPYEF